MYVYSQSRQHKKADRTETDRRQTIYKPGSDRRKQTHFYNTIEYTQQSCTISITVHEKKNQHEPRHVTNSQQHSEKNAYTHISEFGLSASLKLEGASKATVVQNKGEISNF